MKVAQAIHFLLCFLDIFNYFSMNILTFFTDFFNLVNTLNTSNFIIACQN